MRKIGFGAAQVEGWASELWVKADCMSPEIDPTDIVYEEWFASGCSQKNIFTKLVAARNCLRLVVTREFLWVTSWVPMNIFTELFDLEHVIPLNAILAVRPSSSFVRKAFLLSYRDAQGMEHTLKLLPLRPSDFIRSLGVQSKDATSA